MHCLQSFHICAEWISGIKVFQYAKERPWGQRDYKGTYGLSICNWESTGSANPSLTRDSMETKMRKRMFGKSDVSDHWDWFAFEIWDDQSELWNNSGKLETTENQSCFRNMPWNILGLTPLKLLRFSRFPIVILMIFKITSSAWRPGRIDWRIICRSCMRNIMSGSSPRRYIYKLTNS